MDSERQLREVSTEIESLTAELATLRDKFQVHSSCFTAPTGWRSCSSICPVVLCRRGASGACLLHSAMLVTNVKTFLCPRALRMSIVVLNQ